MLRQLVRTVLISLPLMWLAHAGEMTAIVFKGVPGLQDKAIKTQVIKKLESIGYENVNASENIHDAYEKKYHEKTLDALHFFTVTNEKAMRPLLLANPRFGAFAPFNLLVYKSQKEDTTWMGTLTPEAMLGIIGETDPGRSAAFKKMHGTLATLVDTAMKPTKTQIYTCTKIPKNSLVEMVKTFPKPKDLDSFIEDFQEQFEETFEADHFIVAGYLDFKEAYSDADLAFDRYDAYWIYSICHFVFSNSIFNRGLPQAGVFAPCTVYLYIEKGTNTLHIGMATLENWIPMTGVKDPKKITAMKAMTQSVVSVFKKLGFVKEGAAATAPAATKAAAAVAVATAPRGEPYTIGTPAKNTPTYLSADFVPLEAIKQKLTDNGFTILSTQPILKGETVLTITNPALKATNSFLSALNVVVNDTAREVRLQNPDYLGRAYLGKRFKPGMFDPTLRAFQKALGTLYASKDGMKPSDLPGYHFMMGMPYVGDTVEIASGSDLAARAKGNKTVAYTLPLPDGSTLVGHLLSKRTVKYLKKLGVTYNACMLPYTTLIHGDKAETLDPKYYLALSLPKLSLGEFMKIATVPDAIIKELKKAY